MIVDGYLYGLWVDKREEQLGNRGQARPGRFPLRCTELATGKLQWSQPGFRMGLSMSAADGHVDARSHQTVTLIEANRKAYVEKGRIEKVHDVKNTGPRSQAGLLDWNMPVIARGGGLYIRTPRRDHLLRYPGSRCQPSGPKVRCCAAAFHGLSVISGMLMAAG